MSTFDKIQVIKKLMSQNMSFLTSDFLASDLKSVVTMIESEPYIQSLLFQTLLLSHPLFLLHFLVNRINLGFKALL